MQLECLSSDIVTSGAGMEMSELVNGSLLEFT